MTHRHDSISTPDGKRWYITYHASKRMQLYSITYEEVVDLLYHGASQYAKTDPHVYKVYNKRIELVTNIETGRIITVYTRN